MTFFGIIMIGGAVLCVMSAVAIACGKLLRDV